MNMGMNLKNIPLIRVRPLCATVLTAQQVRSAIKPLAEIAAHSLPRLRLTPQDRMRLAGHLFTDGPELVAALARVVLGHPQDFADVHARVVRAAAHSDRAHAARCVALALRDLATQAEDLAMMDQAAANQEATAVVQQVRAQGEAPGASAPLSIRSGLLGYAAKILARHQEKPRAARRAGAKARAHAKGTPVQKVKPAPLKADRATLRQQTLARVWGRPLHETPSPLPDPER